MNIMMYDLGLLVLFVLFVSIFLYIKRKNLKKEGLLFLYKTKWGIKVIDKTAKRFPKTLKFLSYVSISLGYALMAGILYLFGKIVYLYIAYPNIVRAVKVPPIMPLIPYLPQAFKLSFLPPFYFIYWIIILAIVAILHEFAHGIFMRKYNIKIKSTGFGFFPFFLPVFLAAFVEQDEKSMERTSRFKQKAVLSAGTFANLITALISFGIMVLFFTLAFTPAGITFDNYTYDIIAIGGVSMMNNISLINPTYEDIKELINGTNVDIVEAGGKIYEKGIAGFGKDKKGNYYIKLYEDMPAINAELKGIIFKINGIQITNLEILSETLEQYSPGDKINIETNQGIYEIELDEHPLDEEQVWLGIGFNNQKTGAINKFLSWLTSFKKPNVYYESQIFGGNFIYNFLWWLVLISFSVALVNMLPMGIFDGGRFFYLTILGLTKSKKRAEKWFKGVTKFLLFLVLVLMIFWAFSFI